LLLVEVEVVEEEQVVSLQLLVDLVVELKDIQLLTQQDQQEIFILTQHPHQHHCEDKQLQDKEILEEMVVVHLTKLEEAAVALVALVQMDNHLHRILSVVMVVLDFKMHIELDQMFITLVVAVVVLTLVMVDLLQDQVEMVAVEKEDHKIAQIMVKMEPAAQVAAVAVVPLLKEEAVLVDLESL
jgi:hypothetical protein|tara:strand:+ start:20 stop:571 length:552 start_codon:yes stop_codon:yes gene_type:complete